METRLSFRLRELRKSSSLTPLQVIKKLKEHNIDYSEQSVYKWEEGNVIPPLNIIVALSKIYHCHISYLIGDEDKELRKLSANEIVTLRLFRADFLFRSIANALMTMVDKNIY